MELVGEGRNAERPHKENQMTTKATRAKATKIVTREAVGGKVATKVAKVTEEVKATKEVKADLRLTRRQEVRVATGGYCLCGCGAAANRGRLFVQGHDARLKGQLLRLGRGEVKLDSLPKSVQQLLPTLKTCGCCGSPIWLGKSECDHSRCNCAARRAVVKTKKVKVVASEEDEEDEGDEEDDTDE